MRTELADEKASTACEAGAAELVVPAEQLADVLSCPICLGLLKDPLIAACCQNNFCRECLRTTLLSKPQCPLCRAPLVLQNTLPNRAIRNLLPPSCRHESASGEQQTFRHTTLLVGSRWPTVCLLVLFVLTMACMGVGHSQMPCVSASLQGGIRACQHVPSEGSAELSMRGGNPLEPSVPWGRVAVDASSSQEPARPLRFSPPVLASEASDGGGDADSSNDGGGGGGGGGASQAAWPGDEE